jgi:hypothetical protein
MYIIILTLLILVVFFFADTIRTMFSIYINPIRKMYFGSMWFICLLIINLILILFTIAFYYYIIYREGKKGLPGNKGFPGDIGDTCTIPDSGQCNHD